MPHLALESGNPWTGKNAASYTRFVMPFGFSLKEGRSNSNGPHFTETIGGEYERKYALEERQAYFTEDTCKVLFNRARWFELTRMTAPFTFDAQLLLPGTMPKDIKLGMTVPRLVLFECQPEMDDPLTTGFLFLDIYLQKTDKWTPNFEDLLEINELFRYRKRPYDGHAESEDSSGGSHNRMKLLFSDDTLARLRCPAGDDAYRTKCEENAKDRASKSDINSAYDRWLPLLHNYPVHVDGCYYSLLSQDCDWDVYRDDRTFVWTCAIIKGGARALSDQVTGVAESPPADCWPQPKSSFEEQPAHTFGHWIKLLNVDAPDGSFANTHRSTEFEREWARARTYTRWQHCGTLYGFTFHSGALLASPDGPPLWKHFGEMYFDQVLLLLYLRIVLFRFSKKLSDVSSDARSEVGNTEHKREQWVKDFDDLRWHFTLFTNLYQFPLISNQQQGVELYAKARSGLDVDDLYKEIEGEVQQSHAYLSQLNSEKQTQAANNLTLVALIGLGISLAIIYLTLPEEKLLLQAFGRTANEKIVFTIIFWVLFLIALFFLSRLIWKWLPNFVRQITKSDERSRSGNMRKGSKS